MLFTDKNITLIEDLSLSVVQPLQTFLAVGIHIPSELLAIEIRRYEN